MSVSDPVRCESISKDPGRIRSELHRGYMSFPDVRGDAGHAHEICMAMTRWGGIYWRAGGGCILVVTRTDLVEPQSLGVRFQCFLVVFLALLYEAKNMPANVRGKIDAYALLDQLEAFFAASHVGQN